jgi:outer membrane protein TolC
MNEATMRKRLQSAFLTISVLGLAAVLQAQVPQAQALQTQALQAQARKKTQLSIEQAIQTGLENSKALRTSQFKVTAADAKASEVNTLGLPSLKFNGSYTRLSSVPGMTLAWPVGIDATTNTLKTTNFNLTSDIVNNYGLKATLQQPLFTGGKISGAIDAAQYSAEATKEDMKRDRADVQFNIQSAYWTLYRANEFKKVIDQNVEQMKSHTADAENLYKQGMLTNNDVMKVRVQLSDALVRQIDADNNVTLAMYALNNTLGLPLRTEIELTSVIQVADRDWAPVDQLVSQAFDKRPEMLGMNARVKASEAGLTSARGAWWPQIYLIGDYNYNRPNSRYFPSTDVFKDSWDVTVALSFDLWNWNQTGHQTTQAHAQLAQAEEGLSMTKDGITLEVTQSYLAIHKSKERKSVAEQEVQQAEENYRITDGKFKQGFSTASDLLDAEVALLQAKLNLTQSLVDYELAIAQLSKSIGE